MQPKPDTQLKLCKQDEHLSSDGRWRSFPTVPHLLQYVSNANYYARIKVKGKVIREGLKTTVWTTAKLRLTDFLKDHQETCIDIPTVSRWLGHKDGGALAMKTYGHLRNEHSQAMAQKVNLTPPRWLEHKDGGAMRVVPAEWWPGRVRR